MHLNPLSLLKGFGSINVVSICEFNIALRKLSEYCKFGTNLDDSLRDRFVCGLKSEAIQKKKTTVDGA